MYAGFFCFNEELYIKKEINMSGLPQLIASEPEVVASVEEEEVVTVIPASEEKIYDKYWMTQLHIIAQSPTEEAKMIAVFSPARDITVNVDGEDIVIKELMPDAEDVKIVVPDLFERMATDIDLATVMGGVLVELIKIGQEKGVIAT